MMDETMFGEKRSFEDVVGTDLANKKARTGGDVRSVVCLKQVAEMVIVLAAMGTMRGGRKPTAVEVEMMAEARGKLGEICEEFAPKDVFPIDAFGTVIEDLGLNRTTETKSGILPTKMSIAQKLQFTKQKMENSESFSLHSDNTPISSRSFQNHSSVANASAISNSRNLQYQLPTSEVRPVGSTVEVAGRSFAVSNTRSAHLTNTNHHTNIVQPSAANNHHEVAKIVQKTLHPNKRDNQTWNPPSRDYMNKALTCQTCKTMINEVDTLLVCDACEKGYHLKCLQCNLKSIFGDDCHEWHCAKCLTISNGKPLPIKYGRVMKNTNTPKRPASSAGVQPYLEKKVQSSDENFNQRLMSANGDSGSQTSTNMQISGTEKSFEKSQSNMQTFGNHKDADSCSNVSTQNGIKVQINLKGENGVNEEVVERGNIVKTSESCMHDVEWVGSVINEIDGKMHYESCCVSGIAYKLQDYALFSSFGNNLTPCKLQTMWEDNKTNKKFVTVTRCYFPDALPEGVGRPIAPENNEVYDSNHETTLSAGLIHGPCEVLPPRKFPDEARTSQTHSQTKTLDKQKRFFLCKWFYDEKKDLFRDVTCDC